MLVSVIYQSFFLHYFSIIFISGKKYTPTTLLGNYQTMFNHICFGSSAIFCRIPRSSSIIHWISSNAWITKLNVCIKLQTHIQRQTSTYIQIHIHMLRDKYCLGHDMYRQTNLGTPKLQHDEWQQQQLRLKKKQ